MTIKHAAQVAATLAAIGLVTVAHDPASLPQGIETSHVCNDTCLVQTGEDSGLFDLLDHFHEAGDHWSEERREAVEKGEENENAPKLAGYAFTNATEQWNISDQPETDFQD